MSTYTYLTLLRVYLSYEIQKKNLFIVRICKFGIKFGFQIYK